MRSPKYVILQVCLILGIIFLVLMIFRSIMRPEKLKNIYEARKAEVVVKLKDIRTMQAFYKAEKGSYANTFEQLRDFWENGKMTIVVKEGTVPDTLTEAEALKLKIIRRDTVIVNAKEEMLRSLPNFDIDRFDVVPYSKGERFSIAADTIVRAGISVYVYQVLAERKQYLKDLDSDPRIKGFWGSFLYSGLQEQFLGPNYDFRENVTDIILGSLTEPSTDGNWE
jgi:hypothetical protein